MKKKSNTNKKKLDKKSRRKKEKLDGLVGVKMCSCFPMFVGKCEGMCQLKHTHKKIVQCDCLYYVKDTEEYVALNKKNKKPNRGADESSEKDRRRERFKFKNENREDE